MRKEVGLLIAFVIYLGVGLFCSKDFGVAWDDWIMRDNALRNIEWATQFINHSATSREEIFQGNIDEHGPAFQLLLVAAEQLTGVTEPAQIIRIRQVTTFLFFALLSIGFYRLLRLSGFSSFYAFLGWISLIFYPRIFTHSIINSKDPILMLLFVWLAYFLLKIAHQNRIKWHLLFAITLGIATDIRIISLLFLGLYVVQFLVLTYRQPQQLKRSFALFLLVFALFVSSSILVWPYLWHHPLQSFWQQFSVITDVKQPNFTLFLGEFFAPKEAPRWYLPAFLIMTLPIVLWIFISVGTVDRFRHLFHNFWREITQNNAFYLSAFVVAIPLLAAVLLKPVFYNGWRHFQFIFPFLIVLALYGLRFFARFKFVHLLYSHRWIIASFGYLFLLSYTVWLHPKGGSYYNFWVGDHLEQQLECDYWGVNFKQGWEYVLENTEGELTVMVSDWPGKLNYDLLPATEKQRITLVNSLEEADLFITNHLHFKDFSTPLWHSFYFGPHRPALGNEVFSLSTPQATVLRVYQLR